MDIPINAIPKTAIPIPTRGLNPAKPMPDIVIHKPEKNKKILKMEKIIICFLNRGTY